MTWTVQVPCGEIARLSAHVQRVAMLHHELDGILKAWDELPDAVKTVVHSSLAILSIWREGKLRS